MLIEAPKGAPWDIEIEVESKEDLDCIQQLEREKIRGLFLNLHGRYSLKFLKEFPNLKYLLIAGASGNYAPLALCPQLEELCLAGCLIEEFSGLSGLPLRRLTLEMVRTKGDAPAFPPLLRLEELVLSETAKLADLSFLTAIPTLQTLSLYRQKTKELPNLSTLPALHTLRIRECKLLRGWENLSTAPSLRRLFLAGLPLDFGDLTALSKIPSLKQLSLQEIAYRGKDGRTLAQAVELLGLEPKML